MDYHPANWGKPLRSGASEAEAVLYPNMTPASYYPSAAASGGPVTHTQSPIVTGTSVIAIQFKDGIMMAADNLASYGSLARFRDVERLIPVGASTVIGASGDISDFQHIQRVLQAQTIKEYNFDDGHAMQASHVHEYLSRIMYERRSKSDPLWNSIIVGGVDGKGKTFLGYVDLKGTTYESTTMATGFGAYIALPLLRKAVEGKEKEITEEQAIKLMDDCMRVLFYRDARSLNKIQRATVTAAGVKITEPYSLKTDWGFAEYIRGYGA